ncbi:flagellar motor switch protein FliG [Chelativorans sp. YIM 93263]|uniref:flagellar motor switch protein FliG n=1 Tax=Chelativorans sp. YIM 93263 TaxID=2906648 RepID=UPI002379F387|nr:flagellar motor switch protein FliG [Chelativorans sp. YIM 93263]
MSSSVTLTPAQKAAAILVAMGKPAAGRLLKFFKQDELKALIEAARLLRTIPQAELEKVVEEFEHEFTEGAGLLDSADSMDTILSESLSPEEINILMGRGSPKPVSMEEVWSSLEKVGPERLAQLLEREHSQTVAVILASLAPTVAAKTISLLEKTRRGEIMRRMASMGQITPAVRSLIEKRIADILHAEASGKDASAGQARVARILSELEKPDMDALMQELEEAGSEDVDAIRSRVFAFDDVVHLTQKARVALFDGMPTDVVTLALRNAPRELSEAVLSSLGVRSRRMIESELEVPADDIQNEDIVNARRRIALSAVELAQKGVLELPSAMSAQ